MIQKKIIENLKLLVPQVSTINAAILYGSFARNEPSWRSDIDVALIVNEEFNPSNFAQFLHDNLPEVKFKHVIQLRSKVVVYFNRSPKLELSWNVDINQLKRDFLGSEISNVEECVLFDRKAELGNIVNHLTTLNSARAHRQSIMQLAKSLSGKFIYEFENFSSSHARSDSYRSYFFYNIALHCAIQLKQLASGEARFNFLPKNFANMYIDKDEQAIYRQLRGTLYLPEVNQIKRNLLNFYYSAVSDIGLYGDKQFEQIKEFLEELYRRDFLWNFRDAAELNPLIRPGVFYRSSSMTRYQNEPFFGQFLVEKGVNVIIDLRDDDEVKLNPYFQDKISEFRYVRLPIDPRKQSEAFIARYHYGTHQEIAYRHFAEGHKHCFKRLFEEVTPCVDRFVVHCHAGKDRTGAFVALVSLLLGAEMNTVLDDYFASEMDTQEANLKAFLEVVDHYGGAESYLLECGVTTEQISLWRRNLLRNA